MVGEFIAMIFYHTLQLHLLSRRKYVVLRWPNTKPCKVAFIFKDGQNRVYWSLWKSISNWLQTDVATNMFNISWSNQDLWILSQGRHIWHDTHHHLVPQLPLEIWHSINCNSPDLLFQHGIAYDSIHEWKALNCVDLPIPTYKKPITIYEKVLECHPKWKRFATRIKRKEDFRSPRRFQRSHVWVSVSIMSVDHHNAWIWH